MTRIVGWNVHKGGRVDGTDRIGDLVGAVDELAPDVVVLSEITAATHADWVVGLRQIGLSHQMSTVDGLTADEKYALVIASCEELVAVERSAGCPFPPRVLTVEVGDLTLTGIHPPWNVEEGGDRFYDWLRTAVAPLRDRRAAIVGDFNVDPADPEDELEPHVRGLLEDGWRNGLRDADPTGDHSSVFWDVGPRALDHCFLSPATSIELVSAHIVGPSDDVAMPAEGFGVDDGALSDHRPIVVDLR